ncbi:hypothetical protein [Nocardia rosealba]|uniref:hypothetical protein n=1 Tax=Nocardia rosealba TaxID=2878563 RepID=UPI001CDA14D6|nr:hypothetical protein [Nocardia rosealba]MCA2207348.1 hypothetical protein [Nocardia rosealba]
MMKRIFLISAVFGFALLLFACQSDDRQERLPNSTSAVAPASSLTPTPQSPPAPPAEGPDIPPAVEPVVPQPSVIAPVPSRSEQPLEYSCSDAAWREAMGAEGDALCGSTWQPYPPPTSTPAAFLYCDGTVGIYDAGGYQYGDPKCVNGSKAPQTYTDEQGEWIYICTGPDDPRPAAECTIPAN